MTLSALFVTCVLEAALFHELDTTTPFSCVLSSRHQNRVVMDKGRLEKAICAEGKVSLQLEELSGQMIIYTLEEIEEPLVITLVTDGGLVQDLEVTFEERSAEVIILTNPSDRARENQSADEPIVAILNQILAGNTPRGYSYFQGNCQTVWLAKGVFGNLVSLFEGPTDTIYLLRVTNRNRHAVTLHERQVSKGMGLWAYLAERDLGAGQACLGVVAVRRDSCTPYPMGAR